MNPFLSEWFVNFKWLLNMCMNEILEMKNVVKWSLYIHVLNVIQRQKGHSTNQCVFQIRCLQYFTLPIDTRTMVHLIETFYFQTSCLSLLLPHVMLSKYSLWLLAYWLSSIYSYGLQTPCFMCHAGTSFQEILCKFCAKLVDIACWYRKYTM